MQGLMLRQQLATVKTVSPSLSSFQNRRLGEAFDEWADAAVDSAAAKAATQAAQLRRQLLGAQAEAARLAADNARYARLIDDPDWGDDMTDRSLHACVLAGCCRLYEGTSHSEQRCNGVVCWHDRMHMTGIAAHNRCQFMYAAALPGLQHDLTWCWADRAGCCAGFRNHGVVKSPL